MCGLPSEISLLACGNRIPRQAKMPDRDSFSVCIWASWPAKAMSRSRAVMEEDSPAPNWGLRWHLSRSNEVGRCLRASMMTLRRLGLSVSALLLVRINLAVKAIPPQYTHAVSIQPLSPRRTILRPGLAGWLAQTSAPIPQAAPTLVSQERSL